MKKITAAILLFYFSTLATAGSTDPNKIEQILVTQGGSVFFKAGAQISPPACSVANEWAFQVVGTYASSGKAMLATLLAAQAQDKNIRIVGTGVCDIISDRETVGYIIIN